MEGLLGGKDKGIVGGIVGDIMGGGKLFGDVISKGGLTDLGVGGIGGLLDLCVIEAGVGGGLLETGDGDLEESGEPN